ncbi:MAG: DegT/DnrJ/EryC1/StrS family aminotransferase [Candidatus Marinimicrobia bacterium]|nr:DegT/DnrJ/EryC1/StrS family aminotransferase [Candidatus Neomarinimicrobiota bacterium]MBL7109959.1 DegT/DnrJ/EryC1/StrS family aminotransferase [Candidatus Neomarinimicrobiota bacterium]
MNIPFHKPHITQTEIDAVVDTLKSGWLTMGPKTIEFEKQFKSYIGCEFALNLNSATSALHLALKAIGLQAGDEVIIPTNTFIATAEVITYFGAKPVLCDIHYANHNIDVSKIESLLTKNTKAIIPVHFGGYPCDMDEILNLSNAYKLKVIEDAAHALPSYYKGKTIGTLGDLTCFSFYSTKTLSTGEGGMVVTNDKEYSKTISINRLHGISKDAWKRYSKHSDWYYEVVDFGYKYNSTDISASLGIAQLAKVDWMRDKRKNIAQQYLDGLSDSCVILPEYNQDNETSWHLFVIKINNRDELYHQLKKNGVSTSVHFIPVHKHKYYGKEFHYENNDYPIANKVFEQSLSLPIYPSMIKEEIDYIIKLVKKYAK